MLGTCLVVALTSVVNPTINHTRCFPEMDGSDHRKLEGYDSSECIILSAVFIKHSRSIHTPVDILS